MRAPLEKVPHIRKGSQTVGDVRLGARDASEMAPSVIRNRDSSNGHSTTPLTSAYDLAAHFLAADVFGKFGTVIFGKNSKCILCI